MKISLILPAYNEQKIIADTIATCENYLSASFTDYELIISDDGSTDDTVKVAKQAAKSPYTRVISYEKNKGKGGAVRAGVMASTGDIVVYTDADLAFGVEIITPMTQHLLNNNSDLVLGTRRSGGYAGYPFLRMVASKTYVHVLRAFGLKYSDSQCGIKSLNGAFARSVFALCDSDSFAFDFEMILFAQKLGGKIDEFSVTVINHRESSVNLLRDSVKMLRELIRIKKHVGKKT